MHFNFIFVRGPTIKIFLIFFVGTGIISDSFDRPFGTWSTSRSSPKVSSISDELLESMSISARGPFLLSKLWLDPVRHRLPSIYARGRIVNGDESSWIPTQWKRNVSTESSTTSTHAPKSQGRDVHMLTNSALVQQGPHVEQPGSSSNSERQRTHQFDTYKFVLALQSAGYSRPQAVALMKCLRAVLVNGTEFAKSHYLSRGDLENVSPCW